jgi:peptide subunit release factor 1 (eRF1)
MSEFYVVISKKYTERVSYKCEECGCINQVTKRKTPESFGCKNCEHITTLKNETTDISKL